MITILSLDTTSKFASVSVSQGEEVILEYNFATRDELSSTLIPSIEFVLNSASIKLSDVDVFGIGIGPGLFTGIRIGLSTLKGLVFGSGKPIVPVVTLHALAYKYLGSGSPIVSLIDARRKEVYAAVYSSEDKKISETLPPTLMSIQQVPEFLEQLDSQTFRFVGSGAEVHKDFLKERFPKKKIYHRSYFLASEICKIAFSQFQDNNCITDLQQLSPLYIRKPDAELNLKKK